MMNIAVFASGSGTNFDKIIEAIERGELEAKVALLVSDRPLSRVVEKAHAYGVEVFHFQPKDYLKKEDYENEILAELKKREIAGIALAGYMRLIGDVLLSAYEGRIINLHPSLLPSFPGKDAIGQAYAAGVRITGITIHFVDAGMDTGPIIEQKSLEIFKGEAVEDLAGRIHALEHEWYPKVLHRIIKENWEVISNDSTCTH